MEHTNGDTRRNGMTVARGGIVVAKRLDVESLPLPAVSYELRSERGERTEVTLVEQLPSTVDADRVGYHPEYGGDGWACYDGGELVWRGELAPGESRRVVLAVWLDEPETALSLLTPPTVESVRGVAEGTDPRLLDETLLAGAGRTAGTDAVADCVPAGTLRSVDDPAPALADLPNPGDGLDAPPRAVVDEAADAIAGGGSGEEHDRYYHLRLSVESADRGERDVSVLEDLTNALSVLYADADDRDGGAWRVLDVAIGTNWQAERIVTALGDDHRVSGLVVTELTGAVAARTASQAEPTTDPNPDEFAASVFEAATPVEPDDGTDPDGAGHDGETADAGGPSEPAGTEDGDGTPPAVDEPEPAATADGDLDSPGGFEFGDGAAATDDPAAGAEAVDDEFGFGEESALAQQRDATDDPSTDGTPDDEETAGEFAFDAGDATEFGVDGASDFGDDPVDFDDGSAGFDDEPEEFDTETLDGLDGSPADEPVAEPDDAMATFAELKAETEQADVAELDAELSDVVLSPTGSEEYSIDQLIESVEDDAERSSV